MTTEINDVLLEKWAEGFNAECEACGVDPIELLKFSQQESLIDRAKAIPERMRNLVTGTGKAIVNDMQDTGAWWGNATANMRPGLAARSAVSSAGQAIANKAPGVADKLLGGIPSALGKATSNIRL